MNSESNAQLFTEYNTNITAFFSSTTNLDKQYFNASPCDTWSGEVIIDYQISEITFLDFVSTLGGCEGEMGSQYAILSEIINKHDLFFDNFFNGAKFNFNVIEQTATEPKTLTLTKSNGDFAVYNELVLSVKNRFISTHNLSVYPNPAVNKLFVSSNLDIENTDYEIIDFTGKIVLKGMLNYEKSVKVNQLKRGIYFIKAKTKNNIFLINNFVKN
ncbi:T9SS type A sorting domain-containing protein [Seonamhaeicola sp. MEBiC1930]|uniref:T9SS type A sorting domain-containing protein n=1 Tax=Seonamhaeicola sp. MEBiC01930 TaxID=2976768 RepID=UPI003248C33D